MSKRSGMYTQIQELIDSELTKFFALIQSRYSVPSAELEELWRTNRIQSDETTENEIGSKSNDPDSSEDLDEEKLLSSSLKVLRALCKKHGHKKYSKLKKLEMISLLLGKTAPTVQPRPKKAKTKPKEVLVPKVIGQIQKQKIEIRRNENGDYMHVPTRLVFDKETKQVIGKYKPGSQEIQTLSIEDIEQCNQYKFAYVTPENITKKNKEEVKDERNLRRKSRRYNFRATN